MQTCLIHSTSLVRCSRLSYSLDPKQILSLAHSLAGLPPIFHGKVKNFLASLVAKILRSSSSSCEGGHVQPPAQQMAGLASTVQIGSMYLQSSLLLHEHVWESVVEYSNDGSGAGVGGHAEDDSCCRQTQTRIDVESVGLAPVVMLELCWWMERRLSLAQHSMTAGQMNDGMAGLLRLLRGVLTHPLIERALKVAFRARGSTMPPLERLVSIEMAMSSENEFGGASIKLMVLESVTLDRVAVNSAASAEGGQNGSDFDQSAAAQPPDKRGASSVSDVWNDCAACLFGNASLRDAASRRIRRGSMPSKGCIAGVEETVRDWETRFHPMWRDTNADDRHTHWSTEGVDGVLDSIIQVMGKLCNLEAAAGSVCKKVGAHESSEKTCDVRELGTKGQRRASVLLAEVLALLTRLGIDGYGSALVLVAEVTVPVIGATEGRRKAIESLRLLWEGWFCKMRPLEFGAIDRLMHVALLWYGGRSDENQGNDDFGDDSMTRMLEDLPILGAEMVRNWTRLRRTLQPVIGSRRTSADPFMRDGWACHLDSLYNAGKEILMYSPGAGFAAAATPSATTQVPTHKSGRIPLGPVKNSIPDQKDSAYAQGRDQACTLKDTQNGKAPRARDRDEPITEPCYDHFRDAVAALPHTSAQVVIGVLHAAVEMRTKGPREVSIPLGDAKRVKALTGEPRSSERFGAPELFQETLLKKTGTCDGASGKAWVACVLEPMFGPNPARLAASSLRVLLDTLVWEIGHCRTPNGIGNTGDIAGGARAEVFESLGVSLAVAILGHVPPLVTGMAEPPCLTASSSSVSPIERLGRSLAVLDILKMLSAGHQALDQPGGWIVILLSHYTAALLILVKEHAASALVNQRGWPDVVAFVHARVRSVARQELQRLPVALRLAAQEVDPLLTQYF